MSLQLDAMRKVYLKQNPPPDIDHEALRLVFSQSGIMCGRFNFIATPVQLQAKFGLDYLV
jgi:hypothetical protein